MKGRAEVLSPASVIVLWRWVSSIFPSAVDDGIVRASPCCGVKLPKRERAEAVPLETEYVTTLIDSISDRYRTSVVLAPATGLRQGEVFGLSIARVDFLRRSVRVDRQLMTLQGPNPNLVRRRRRCRGARSRFLG